MQGTSPSTPSQTSQEERKQTGIPPSGQAQVTLTGEHPRAQETESHKGKNRKINLTLIGTRDNIILADKVAKRHKSRNYGVDKFHKHYEENIQSIQDTINAGNYKTTPLRLEERRCEDKMRILAKGIYQDLVAQHAFMNIMEPVLTKSYHPHSTASIKGRGTDYAIKLIRRYLRHKKNRTGTLYWTQTDYIKFFHHINRDFLEKRLFRKFGDKDVQNFIHDIIYALGEHNGLTLSNGKEGVGLGLNPVQPFVNYYTDFVDRELSKIKGLWFIHYSDNYLYIAHEPEIIIQAVELHKSLAKEFYHQEMHPEIGIQKLTPTHPIHFIGYKFYQDGHILVKNKTKYKFKRKVKRHKDNPEALQPILAAYKGILHRGNCLHLWQTVTDMKTLEELNITPNNLTVNGKRVFKANNFQPGVFIDQVITVIDYELGVKTRYSENQALLLIEVNDKRYKWFTGSMEIKNILEQIDIKRLTQPDILPFQATLKRELLPNNHITYYFQ